MDISLNEFRVDLLPRLVARERLRIGPIGRK
jgi:hypothetical protein